MSDYVSYAVLNILIANYYPFVTKRTCKILWVLAWYIFISLVYSLLSRLKLKVGEWNGNLVFMKELSLILNPMKIYIVLWFYC